MLLNKISELLKKITIIQQQNNGTTANKETFMQNIRDILKDSLHLFGELNKIKHKDANTLKQLNCTLTKVLKLFNSSNGTNFKYTLVATRLIERLCYSIRIDQIRNSETTSIAEAKGMLDDLSKLSQLYTSTKLKNNMQYILSVMQNYLNALADMMDNDLDCANAQLKKFMTNNNDQYISKALEIISNDTPEIMAGLDKELDNALDIINKQKMQCMTENAVSLFIVQSLTAVLAMVSINDRNKSNSNDDRKVLYTNPGSKNKCRGIAEIIKQSNNNLTTRDYKQCIGCIVDDLGDTFDNMCNHNDISSKSEIGRITSLKNEIGKQLEANKLTTSFAKKDGDKEKNKLLNLVEQFHTALNTHIQASPYYIDPNTQLQGASSKPAEEANELLCVE